jgi:hypothetical protein
MGLINVTASFFNPVELSCLTWFVIVAQVDGNCAIVFASYCSAVSDINDVHIVVEGHNQVSTTARLAALHLLGGLVFSVHLAHVVVVGDSAAFGNGGRNIVWKVWLHYDIVVQVLLEILSALVSSMAIVNCKDLDLGPLVLPDFGFLADRLNNIQYNCNSVFICFAHQTNVSVCCKALHHSELFVRRF